MPDLHVLGVRGQSSITRCCRCAVVPCATNVMDLCVWRQKCKPVTKELIISDCMLFLSERKQVIYIMTCLFLSDCIEVSGIATWFQIWVGETHRMGSNFICRANGNRSWRGRNLTWGVGPSYKRFGGPTWRKKIRVGFRQIFRGKCSQPAAPLGAFPPLLHLPPSSQYMPMWLVRWSRSTSWIIILFTHLKLMAPQVSSSRRAETGGSLSHPVLPLIAGNRSLGILLC